jgi:hypothetical protein
MEGRMFVVVHVARPHVACALLTSPPPPPLRLFFTKIFSEIISVYRRRLTFVCLLIQDNYNGISLPP